MAESIADEASFVLVEDDLRATNPLAWPRYDEALENARRQSGGDESVIAGPAAIRGHGVELALFEFAFMGGSMGEVAGERLARGLERAARRGVPFILQTSTGGARMQEGMQALVQMPKLVAARLELSHAHQPFIAVLGHPTTGGVLASIGALADVTIAQEGAMIGFAGPRIVEAFTGARLTGASHTAASALKNGLVDAVVPAPETRELVGRVIDVLAEQRRDRPQSSPDTTSSHQEPVDSWSAVEAARSMDRPTGPRLLRDMSDSVVELHGDRSGADDPAVATAIARVQGRRAVVLALDRHHAPRPAAYRQACRCIDIAARLRLPLVTIVDTPGADPSEESESQGIAWWIARLFEAMLDAPVPTLCVVTGEGGSGGALAFATADVLVAFEDSFFSVIAPESAATILWRDETRAREAAGLLKLTAHDLVRLGIADALVAPPVTGETVAELVGYHLGNFENDARSSDERISTRMKRWRNRV